MFDDLQRRRRRQGIHDEMEELVTRLHDLVWLWWDNDDIDVERALTPACNCHRGQLHLPFVARSQILPQPSARARRDP